MVRIPLRNSGKMAMVDDADYDCVAAHLWSWRRERTNEYPIARIDRKIVTMHKLLMPDCAMVDHRDGNGLNNQRSNIRAATKKTNAQNRHVIRGKSPFKGVRPLFYNHVVSYNARIAVDGIRKDLGSYSNPISAALAYDTAAEKHFGEFACMNFKGK